MMYLDLQLKNWLPIPYLIVQFQNGIHLPLGMEGEQEAQPISWLHNSDSQQMMLSEDPNLLPQR